MSHTSIHQCKRYWNRSCVSNQCFVAVEDVLYVRGAYFLAHIIVPARLNHHFGAVGPYNVLKFNASWLRITCLSRPNDAATHECGDHKGCPAKQHDPFLVSHLFGIVKLHLFPIFRCFFIPHATWAALLHCYRAPHCVVFKNKMWRLCHEGLFLAHPDTK